MRDDTVEASDRDKREKEREEWREGKETRSKAWHDSPMNKTLQVERSEKYLRVTDNAIPVRLGGVVSSDIIYDMILIWERI